MGLGFASDGQKTIQKGGRVLGNDIFQFDYSGPILTPILNYDKFYTPYPPSLEPPLGNQFTLGLEKKKADSSSTQPPLSESAKKWVPKISTDGPLKSNSNNFFKNQNIKM